MARLKRLMAIALCLGLLTGCSWLNLGDSSGRPLSSQPPTNYWTVERVHDGDTLWVEQNGQEVKIRLCGIDAPELDQPLGQASRDRLKQLVAESYDGRVGVIAVERDQYGRLVGEVYVPVAPGQEMFANSQMVSEGMAYVYQRHVGGCPHGAAIATAEKRAKSLTKGVWQGGQVPPWQYRRENS